MSTLDIGFDEIMAYHPAGCVYVQMDEDAIVSNADCCRGLVEALERKESIEEWQEKNCLKCDKYFGSEEFGEA